MNTFNFKLNLVFISSFCFLLTLTALGQITENELFNEPPLQEAKVFGPGLISTGLNEFNAVFTPDLKEFYFSIRHRTDYFVILVTKSVDKVYQEPEIAKFSGKFNDADPFITADGKYLYFCSDRPTHALDTFPDWNIWRMEREGESWNKPILLEFNTEMKNEMYPSVAYNGNIYFHSDIESPQMQVDFNRTDIYMSELKNGRYRGYNKILPLSTKEYPEWDPFISPKEDYLIFTSSRPGGFGSGDLFISFKNKTGSWSLPMNMGEKVNSNGMDYCPSLSPDGKYLFFSSYRNLISFEMPPATYNEIIKKINSPQNGNGDIYWIDSKIIETLKQ